MNANATLTVGSAQDLQTFDPALAPAGGDQKQYLSLVYDYLLRTTYQGGHIPDLATSWSYQNLTTVSFTLRGGVKYQDGSTFDATTAKESLERSIQTGGPRAADLLLISRIDVLAPYTLRITLKSPDPNLLATLGSSPGAMLSPEAFNRPNLRLDPDGTGPYTYDPTHSQPGDHYSFVANPNWWDNSMVRPHTIEFKVITDSNARLNALLSGQIDMTKITAPQAAQAKSAGLDLATSPDTWAGMLILDRNGQEVPALGNEKVRQAIGMAFDRKAIVQAALFGQGIDTDQPFSTDGPYADPSVESEYAYNPTRARQLIAESGFKNISFTAPVRQSDVEVAQIMKQELAAIGVNMTIHVIQPNQGGPLGRSTKYPVLTFPMPASDPWGRYLSGWSTQATYNPFHVDDPTLDRLETQYSETLPTDRTKLQSIARQIATEVVNQGIQIVVAQPDTIVAYNPKLKGVSAHDTTTQILYTHF